jgi:hypothetical protein
MPLQALPSIDSASRARQNSVGGSRPLPLAVASLDVDGRQRARAPGSVVEWHGESPWRVHNRCIAGGDWMSPIGSWIAQQRSHWRH